MVVIKRIIIKRKTEIKEIRKVVEKYVKKVRVLEEKLTHVTNSEEKVKIQKELKAVYAKIHKHEVRLETVEEKAIETLERTIHILEQKLTQTTSQQDKAQVQKELDAIKARIRKTEHYLEKVREMLKDAKRSLRAIKKHIRRLRGQHGQHGGSSSDPSHQVVVIKRIIIKRKTEIKEIRKVVEKYVKKVRVLEEKLTHVTNSEEKVKIQKELKAVYAKIHKHEVRLETVEEKAIETLERTIHILEQKLTQTTSQQDKAQVQKELDAIKARIRKTEHYLEKVREMLKDAKRSLRAIKKHIRRLRGQHGQHGQHGGSSSDPSHQVVVIKRIIIKRKTEIKEIRKVVEKYVKKVRVLEEKLTHVTNSEEKVKIQKELKAVYAKIHKHEVRLETVEEKAIETLERTIHILEQKLTQTTSQQDKAQVQKELDAIKARIRKTEHYLEKVREMLKDAKRSLRAIKKHIRRLRGQHGQHGGSSSDPSHQVVVIKRIIIKRKTEIKEIRKVVEKYVKKVRVLEEKLTHVTKKVVEKYVKKVRVLEEKLTHAFWKRS